MEDILDRLQAALDGLGKTTYSDSTSCHCDPDVGAVPCELCGEKELLKDAKKEIERLRRFERVYKGTAGKLRKIMDSLLALRDKEAAEAAGEGDDER